jgi:N-acetylneuraminate synthase/N,N'-diacetyllegionaminate synthase
MKHVIIIAEAGVNHNGDFELAKRLIAAAADAGADYVKFQTFKTENLVSKSAQKASYQSKNINDGDNLQYQMLKKLEMPYEWHYELMKYANGCGIKFLSTGFDEESIDFLTNLGIDLLKIPSGEITNKPYLRHVARKRLPVILSTGMATLQEVEAAMYVLMEEGIDKSRITILHCNTEYPTPMKDVNLKAMNYIGETLGVTVGYSDHTMGIEVPIAAVALGATVIEKHFTLDKTMIGPDHIASLEPEELKIMVEAIRKIEQAISGSGIKEPSESELKNISIVRKSLHFKYNLPEGHVITERDLIALRPGSGISPMEIDKYIGQKLIENVGEFSMVKIRNFHD